MNRIIIKVIGWVHVSYGIFYCYLSFWTFLAFKSIFTQGVNSDTDLLFYFVFPLYILNISFLPIAKLITGYGLIRLRSWSLKPTIIILILDLIIQVLLAILYLAKGTVIHIGMGMNKGMGIDLSSFHWIAFLIIDIIFLILLLKKPAREIFLRQGHPERNYA